MLGEAIEATAEEQIADAITRFTGSMTFVYLHLAFFGCWIIAPEAVLDQIEARKSQEKPTDRPR